MAQYFKLTKKISAGAQYLVTQLGYDARKFHEVLQFLKTNNLDIPVLGNIFAEDVGFFEVHLLSPCLRKCALRDKRGGAWIRCRLVRDTHRLYQCQLIEGRRGM